MIYKMFVHDSRKQMSTKLKKYEECSYEASEYLAADCIVNIRSVAAYQGQRIESKR